MSLKFSLCHTVCWPRGALRTVSPGISSLPWLLRDLFECSLGPCSVSESSVDASDLMSLPDPAGQQSSLRAEADKQSSWSPEGEASSSTSPHPSFASFFARLVRYLSNLHRFGVPQFTGATGCPGQATRLSIGDLMASAGHFMQRSQDGREVTSNVDHDAEPVGGWHVMSHRLSSTTRHKEYGSARGRVWHFWRGSSKPTIGQERLPGNAANASTNRAHHSPPSPLISSEPVHPLPTTLRA